MREEEDTVPKPALIPSYHYHHCSVQRGPRAQLEPPRADPDGGHPARHPRLGWDRQGSYNGRILGKKSENQTFALFWSEFGGIFKSLEKFGGI